MLYIIIINIILYLKFFKEVEEIKKNKAANIISKEKDKEKQYIYKSKITVGARALSKHSDRSKDVKIKIIIFTLINNNYHNTKAFLGYSFGNRIR